MTQFSFEIESPAPLARERLEEYREQFALLLGVPLDSVSIPPSPTTPDVRAVVEPADPHVILAGIKQFGLAADGADLRDLSAALTALSARVEELTAERDKALTYRDTAQRQLDRIDEVLGWHGTGLGRVESASQLRQERDAAMDEVSRLATELAKALAKRWDAIVKEG